MTTFARSAPLPTMRSQPVIRAIDVVVASMLLVLMSPLLLVAGAAVAATSRGPALYRQTRIGRRQQPFEMLKFRSMVVNNDDTAHRAFASRQLTHDSSASGGTFKLENDPRITTVGEVIRRFSIDEIPQLWNVVRGDMSLCGPRPMLPWEVELLEERHLERMEVRPGCTGLWQVSGRSLLSSREMLELDLQFVREDSVARRLKILLLTPAAVLRGDGAG